MVQTTLDPTPGECPIILTSGKRAGEPCGANTKDGLPVCGRHDKPEQINAAKKASKKAKQAEAIDDHLKNLGFDPAVSRSWHKAKENYKRHGKAVVDGEPKIPSRKDVIWARKQKSLDLGFKKSGKTKKKKEPKMSKEDKRRRKERLEVREEAKITAEIHDFEKAAEHGDCAYCKLEPICMVWQELSMTIEHNEGLMRFYGKRRLGKALGQECPAFTLRGARGRKGAK